MSNTVVVILDYETNIHLGIAVDTPSAIDCMIVSHMITADFLLWDEERQEWETIADRYGENWEEIFREWDTDTFNTEMEGWFLLSIEDVYERVI